MRHFPEPGEKYDNDELKNLNAEPWQIDLLKLNPGYCSWGNFEDYMDIDDEGWASRRFVDRISEIHGLDNLNECVNFYFELNRKSHRCEHCDGTSYNPPTKKLSDDWYKFDEAEWIEVSEKQRYNNLAWQYHLTQVEVDALWEAGRLKFEFNEKPTTKQVNEWAKRCGMGHDAINQIICVKARAKHMGVYGSCQHCFCGEIYDEPSAKVALQLWVLHPRKGCSHGVYVREVKHEDLPAVYEYLNTARERNDERFSKIPKTKRRK